MKNQIVTDKKFKLPSSVSDQAELFRFAIMYDHQKPLKIISTNVKRPYSSLSEEILNFMYPAVAGADNFVSGLWNVFTFPVTALMSIAIIIQNIRSIDSKDALPFVGLSASLLLSYFSAMIGGLLMIASTPFVAVARLVEVCFPGTFGVNASDALSSEADSNKMVSGEGEVVGQKNNLPKQQTTTMFSKDTVDINVSKARLEALQRHGLFDVILTKAPLFEEETLDISCHNHPVST